MNISCLYVLKTNIGSIRFGCCLLGMNIIPICFCQVINLLTQGKAEQTKRGVNLNLYSKRIFEIREAF